MTVRRRTLLGLTGSLLAGLAGCTGDADPNPSEDTPDGTPDDTPTDAGDTPDDSDGSSGDTPDDSDRDDEGAAGTAGSTTAQVTLSRKSYLVTAVSPETEERYAPDPNETVPVSEFPEPLSDALSEARNGGFETDEPSEELLAAIDDVRDPGSNHRLPELFVRIDGNEYVAELHLPELEVRLGEETIEEYDPEVVVSLDEFEFDESHDEVEHLLRRIGWDGSPNTARVPYRISRVPTEIEEFLDSYEYVEDYEGVSPIVVERHNWDPPYSIELREFTPEDRWGREVLDGDTLGGDLRAFLDDAVASETGLLTPPFVTDDVPERYFEAVETDGEHSDRPFFDVAGQIYDVKVSEGTHGEMPVTVTAEPTSPTEDGLARFTLTVDATDQKPGVEVATGEPVELYGTVGLPSALWVDHDGEYHLLNSDRYEMEIRSDDDGGSWSLAAEDPTIEEAAVSEPLSVGDRLAATYVVPATVPAGTYTLSGNFAVLWQEDPDEAGQSDGIFPFQIELTLEEA